jgi:hypothetical protein
MNNKHFGHTILFSITMFIIGVHIHGTDILHGVYSQDAVGDSSPRFEGVNMRGLYTSLQYVRFSAPFPDDYYDTSFRLISQAGMNHIRYNFYWEAYEKNPLSFMEELKHVSSLADKWGLNVIYDNHQFHTSSWLNPQGGTGFPTYLFRNNVSYPYNSGGTPSDTSAAKWWTDWWDRRIKDVSGRDGWTLQAEFLKKVVNTVDNNPSTVGYEILSEPEVHSADQWKKIGKYNTFMVDKLREVTKKDIIFSMAIPVDFNSIIGVNAQNLAYMAPVNKTNVIFKFSMYGLASRDSYQEQRLNMFVKTGQLAEVPVYIGEWNNVIRDKVMNEKGDFDYIINNVTSDLNQTSLDALTKKFSDIGAWGWAFWSWNYVPTAPPNFNLITVTSDGNIQATKYYDMIKKSISNLT